MYLKFYKYHGTGNDFILLDNRNLEITNLNAEIISSLCHRRFGIGADGLIIIQPRDGYDFEMIYYNADGNPSSMCGNGGRCMVAFARRLGLIKDSARFLAVDGPHEGFLVDYSPNHSNAYVSLKMNDVQTVKTAPGYFILNTGSPHYVKFVEDIAVVNVNAEGREIRNSEPFKSEGINVNFVRINGEFIEVRTYERGVEEETMSCGTGVVASSIVTGLNQMASQRIKVKTPGGELQVSYDRRGEGFYNVILHGPVTFVFEGHVHY